MKRIILILWGCMIAICDVNASEISASGTPLNGNGCGDNCSWTLYDDGTLAISGTGNMNNYMRVCPSDTTCTTNAPWASFNTNVREIIIQEGISSVGENAFRYFTNLENIDLPQSLEYFSDHACYQCSSLQNITFPNQLLKIGSESLSLTNLHTLVVPASVQEIAPDALTSWVGNVNLHSIYCTAEQNEACSNAVSYLEITPTIYESYGNQFYYNGKFYNNPNDIVSGTHIKKRIYTVEEANKASGKKNSIKIRYK